MTTRVDSFPYLPPEAPKIYYHIFDGSLQYVHSVQVSAKGERKTIVFPKMKNARVWNPSKPYIPRKPWQYSASANLEHLE